MRATSWIGLGFVAVSAVGCAGASDVQVERGSTSDDIDPGKADVQIGRAELKVTVDEADIAKARDGLGLHDSKAEDRDIWFFDTTDLSLYEAGAILRARKVDGEPDDSTVKLRPFVFGDLASDVKSLPGLKCELDRSRDTSTPSCSVTAIQDKGEIADMARGERAIEKLFSSGQEQMLAVEGPALTWEQLVPLGPIPAQVWTVRSDALPAKATAELWTLPDGSQVLELSLKTNEDDGDDALDALEAFIDDHGLDMATEQSSKTRRALEAFAARR